MTSLYPQLGEPLPSFIYHSYFVIIRRRMRVTEGERNICESVLSFTVSLPECPQGQCGLGHGQSQQAGARIYPSYFWTYKWCPALRTPLLDHLTVTNPQWFYLYWAPPSRLWFYGWRLPCAWPVTCHHSTLLQLFLISRSLFMSCVPESLLLASPFMVRSKEGQLRSGSAASEKLPPASLDRTTFKYSSSLALSPKVAPCTWQ